MKLYYALLPSLIVFLCVSTVAKSDNIEIEEKDSYLSYIMEKGLYQYSEFEISNHESIVKHNDDTKYLEFKLFRNQDKVNGGIRSEVSIDYPFQSGNTIEYSYEFLMPEGKFLSDSKNRWWIVGSQFHDQPNRRKNEKWGNFPKHSPSINFSYGFSDNQHLLHLMYGLKNQHVGTLNIKENQWYNIKMAIKWSTKADGKIDVFINNSPKPSISATGANMYNDYQHYWKIGMYRHSNIKTNASLFIRNIQILQK